MGYEHYWKTWASGDRAVSPVVGVALLIAITVILAAVLGGVVLGMGIGPADAPQATLSFQVQDGDILVIHEGGDRLAADEIVIRDASGSEYSLAGGDLVSGERDAIEDADGNTVGPDDVDRISVVWQDPASDSESVMATFQP